MVPLPLSRKLRRRPFSVPPPQKMMMMTMLLIPNKCSIASTMVHILRAKSVLFPNKMMLRRHFEKAPVNSSSNRGTSTSTIRVIGY
jgi:hypothetical protein